MEDLITEHRRKIAPAAGGMGGIFGNGPGINGGGLNAGNPPAVERNEPYQNQDVLDVLVQMADGVNFEYDVPAWKRWYAGRKKAQSFNGRRDD